MATQPLLAPPVVPPAAVGAAPPDISGVGNIAVFIISILGPAFSFPTEDIELDAFNILINLGVVLAAAVILTEVLSFLVLTTEDVRNRIELLKTYALLISMVSIVVGFAFFAPNKSDKNNLPLRTNKILIRPIPAVLLMNLRGRAGYLLVNPLRFKWKQASVLTLSVAVALAASFVV